MCEHTGDELTRDHSEPVLLRDGISLIRGEIVQALAGKHALQLGDRRADRRVRVRSIRIGGVRVLDDRQRFVGVDREADAGDPSGGDVADLAGRAALERDDPGRVVGQDVRTQLLVAEGEPPRLDPEPARFGRVVAESAERDLDDARQPLPGRAQW